jgi:hypothetical protein
MNGESVYFFCINQNKKSITVDMKDARGKAIIRDLARRSDVLLENPSRAPDQAGAGLDDLRQDNPGLIFCSISGFWPDRTDGRARRIRRDRQAVGGLMGITAIPTAPGEGGRGHDRHLHGAVRARRDPGRPVCPRPDGAGTADRRVAPGDADRGPHQHRQLVPQRRGDPGSGERPT